MAIALPSQPLFGAVPEETSDVAISFQKGLRGLTGTSDILFSGLVGNFLETIGLEQQGYEWFSDAYASGLLMGMDLNDLQKQFKGPRTWREVPDAKGALAYGINAFADQVPTLMAQFAPAVATVLLRRIGVPILPKKIGPISTTSATVIATIDWLNTAQVYSNLLMEAGEDRLGVAAGTGALMSSLDMLLPLRVVNRMGRSLDFAKYVGKKFPQSNFKSALAGAIEGGAIEGTTEYVQTIFENMALNYVKENDLMAEFSDAQKTELEEAGVRGGIVGMFLGGAVSYAGAFKASRERAGLYRKLSAFEEEWTPIRGALPAPTAGLSPLEIESLPTMPDTRRLTGPIDSAIEEKLAAASYVWRQQQEQDDFRTDHAAWQIGERKRIWQAILDGDMEAGLNLADQDMLYDLIDLGLEETAFGREAAREAPPPEPAVIKTVPVERGLVRTGFADWGDIRTAPAGKGAWKGWMVLDRQPVRTQTGEYKKKGKGRGYDHSLVYENVDYILKRETELYNSPWVVISKKTDEVVDRNRLKKVLENKYAAAPMAEPGVRRLTEQAQDERLEADAQRHEQQLSERGILPPPIGSKVRFMKRNRATNTWEYPNDEVYDLEDVWYSNVDATGPVARGKTKEISATIKEYTKRRGGRAPTVIYQLRDINGRVENIAIGRTDKDWRVVLRTGAAWKYGQYAPEPISEVEALLRDEEFLTEEQRAELEEYTPRGELVKTATERTRNLRAFRELIGPTEEKDKSSEQRTFWDRFVQAIANAQIVRGERASRNVDRYSVSTREEIEQFIRDSNKTKRALGIPEKVGIEEETKLFERQAVEEAEIRLEEREREELVREADARREGMQEEEVAEGVKPVVPEGEVVAPLTEAELEAPTGVEAFKEEIPIDERPRKIEKEIQEWKDLVKKREGELGRKVTSGALDKTTLTSEELASLKAIEWGGHPTVEYTTAKYKPVRPLTKEARKQVVSTARGAITTRLKEPPPPPPEDRGGIPKGAALIDVLHVDTGLTPIDNPTVFEVKVRDEVAKERGLNPDFFYQFETPGHPARNLGFIRIQGNIIYKEDIVDVQEITGRAVAPIEGDFIEYFSENYIRVRPGTGEVISAATIPDVIPDWRSARRIFIDNDTGIVIVQREADIKLDDIEKMDVDYAYDYEIYLTWYNKEEHRIKLEELNDRLLNIEREVTYPTEAIGEYEKPRRKMLPPRKDVVDLTKNPEFLTTKYDESVRGKEVRITLKPSVMGRINRARVREGLFPWRDREKAKLPDDTRFKVYPAYSKRIHPVEGMDILVGGQLSRRPISNLIRVVSPDGGSYIVNVNSGLKAYITGKPVPEKIGVMVPYEVLVEKGPEKGARLIATFRGSIQEEATSMERFMADMFIPQTHAFGRFGEDKQTYLNARADKLKEATGKNVLVEFFDGATMEGQIRDVSKETGTFTLGVAVPKTRAAAKQRFNYIEVDILGYDRIQIERKVERKRGFPKIEEGFPTPTDFQHSNVVYVPFLVRQTPETPPALPAQVSQAAELRRARKAYEAHVYVPEVEVVKAAGIKKNLYTINVDGSAMSDKVSGKEVSQVLNELYEENVQQLAIISIPEEIQWDGKVEEDAPVEKDVVDVVSKEGLTTQIKLKMPVTITFKGKPPRRFNKKMKGKFTEYIYTEEDYFLGGSVRFEPDKGEVVLYRKREYTELPFGGVIYLKDINFFYDESAIQAERAEKELNKNTKKLSDVINKAIPVVKDTGKKDTKKKTKEIVPQSIGVVDEEHEALLADTVEPSASKKVQDKVKPPVATNTTKKFSDINTTPLGNMPINQKFKDKFGGEWQVVQQVGRDRTLIKFVGGKSPDLDFRVAFEGKKDIVGFQPGMVIDAASNSTASGLYLIRYGGGLGKGEEGEVSGVSAGGSAVKIEEGKVTEIPNFSVVQPVSENGTFVYNTGLTPKTFREVLGKKIGKMKLARLEKDGIIRIVQNQRDVPNPPVNLAVKAVERGGQVWFITNNIREDEISQVFAHDIGVHVGMLNMYGDEVFSFILDSARQLRNSSPTWTESFAAAESVYEKVKKSIPPEEASDFIAEEAVGYYTEATDPMTDSFWAMILDWFRQQMGKGKMYLGKIGINWKLSEAEIIAFVRGGIRGTVNKKFDQAAIRTTERYSVLFGGLDNKAYDYINDKLRDSDSKFVQKVVASGSQLRKSVGTFFKPFKYIPRPALFEKIRSVFMGRMGAVMEKGEEVKKAFENASEKEQEDLYMFFTNVDAKPNMIDNEKLRAAAVEYKALIEEIGLKAFKAGIIPNTGMGAEQFRKLQGAYLPRLFLYHLLHGSKGTTPFGFKPSPRYWSTLRVELTELDQEIRGVITDPAYLVYRAITIPQLDMIILEYLETLSKMKAFGKDEKGNDLPPWVLPEQWVVYEFTDPLTNQKMKRRTTVHVLTEEIDGFIAVRDHVNTPDETKRKIETQLAILAKAREDYYKDKGGSEEGALKYFDEKYNTKMFRQLPKGPRFGALAGFWIRKEIYQDILGNSATSFGETNLFEKMFSPHGRHAKVVGIWKILKVPLNPPTVARNFVNNSMLLQLLGGVPFHRQPGLFREVFQEIFKGVRGTEFTNSEISKNYGLPKKFTAYELAKARGIASTTMVAAEIQQMEQMLLDVERDGILSFTTHFQRLWRMAAKKGGGLYQNLEILGKTVYITDALKSQREHLEEVRRQNLGPDGLPDITLEDAAVLRANEVLFDYSAVSPLVRGLRSSFFGAPFITYQIKVMPQLIKTAANYPWRFLPYVMLFAGAQAAFGSMPFEDDDWDKLMRLAPEWLRNNKHGMLMPWKDANGNWQVADLSYYFPWAGMTQLAGNIYRGEFKQGAQEFGLIAPGWQIAAALTTNKDVWQGRQIINPDDPASDKAMDLFNYMWSMSMPSVITRSGIVNMPSILEAMARLDPAELEGKLFDAAMNRTNRYGDPKKDLLAAALSVVGLGIYPIAPNARARQLRRYRSEIEGYERRLTSVRKDPTLSDKQERRRINTLRDRIDEARQQRRELASSTAGIGA